MKKNKLILWLVVAMSLLLPTTLWAQETGAESAAQTTTTTTKKQSFFKLSNITYGGNFGFHLDSYQFNVLLMPEVGYKLFPRWKVAVAPLYSYYGYINSTYDAGEHTLGVRVGTTFDIFNGTRFPKFNMFVYAGYQYEHHWSSEYGGTEYDANYFDIGLGAKYRISYKANAYLLVSWHAFAEARTGGFRVDTGWFTDPIPSITFGVEIN
jgi:hypothetical protein